MQDCKGEEQNDWIEMKEKKKAEHRESTGEGNGGGEEGETTVIMKTSALWNDIYRALKVREMWRRREWEGGWVGDW